MRRSSLILMLLLVSASSAFSDLTPEQTKRAKALVAQFTAREFAMRQQAVKDLVEMGSDVLPLVRRTLEESADNEEKLRCRMVIEGIEGPPGKKEEEVSRRGEVDFEPALITLKVTDANLEDVLLELRRQSGNDGPLPREDMELPRVTLDVKDRPYWEVIGLICRQAKLTCDPNLPKDRVDLVSLVDERETWTVAGPVALRARRGPKEDDGQTPPADAVYYQIDYFWEDRLPVADAILSIKEIVAPEAGSVQLWKYHREHQWDGEAPSAGRARIRIDGVPDALRQLARIDAGLKITQVSGEIEITVKGNLAKEEAGGAADGFTIAVIHANKEENSVWGVVEAKDPKGEKMLFGPPADARYAFRLVDPEGNRHVPWHVLFGDFGASECGHGGYFAAGTTSAYSRTVGFRVVPDDPDAWSLVCTIPKESVSREYPLSLKDLPVPPKGEK